MQAESRSPPRVHASVSRLNSADVYGPGFSHGRLGPDWHAATIATAARTSARRTLIPAFYHRPFAPAVGAAYRGVHDSLGACRRTRVRAPALPAPAVPGGGSE